MSITAAEVKALRTQTGAGMMDCKRALEESEGNTEKAVEILRLKGQKVAAKRSDREASEGVILSGVSKDGKTGIVMSLNCETDFVAQNADFISLTQTLIDLAITDSCESKDDLLAKNFPGSDITVADRIIDETGKIGELIEIGGFNVSKGETVASYIHPGNRLATVVGFSGSVDAGVGRDVAMQAAAMAPVAVDQSQIPEDLIAKETEIARDLAIQEGKPAELAEKIAIGRLNKWYKEVTLVNQPFIKDNKQTVSQYVASTCPGANIESFSRIALS
ncbi:MAG: elongation factor Ts [Flavobacteriales bacterium]|jgi:elongation factor Ts|nr:elongation factor Ts [Flavobacteriales bacterium]